MEFSFELSQDFIHHFGFWLAVLATLIFLFLSLRGLIENLMGKFVVNGYVAIATTYAAIRLGQLAFGG